MKKLCLLLAVLLTFPVMAQSYHTITIDGNNDFSTPSEEITTTTGSSLKAYVTWDKDYIYFAYSGNSTNGSITDNSRNLHIYIDTDPQATPTSGTGTRTGETWRYAPQLPFTANFHYVFKTTDNTEYRRIFSDGAWQDVNLATGNFKNFAGRYWESRISRSSLGNPKQINLVMYAEEDWNEGFICGGIPSNLFTDININGGQAITFNAKFLNLYLYDQISPNNSYHNTNYQWLLRLKASGASLSDTTAYAGMAYNATDGFDSGIDLPKTPPPPSNYLEVHFPHSDWASALGPNYQRDFRRYKSLDSTSSTWNFTVNTDRANANITISAEDYSFLPSNYPVKLYDVTRDSTFNLRSGNYVYTTGTSAGARLFQLIVGTTLNPPNIALGATSINFGSIKIGKDSTVNLNIQNTGDSTLNVSRLTFSNSVFTTTTTTPVLIGGGSSAAVPVKFAPTATGLVSGTLTVASNDPDSPSLTVSLAGTGLAQSPVISASASAVMFDATKVNRTSTKTFKLYNRGDAALNISGISSTAGVFTVVGSSTFSVPVNDSATVTLQFLPVAAQAYSASLKIAHNDPTQDTLRLTLSGTGIALVPNIYTSVSSVAFGSVMVGYSGTGSLKVYNNGDTTLQVTGFSFTGGVFSTSAASFNVNVGDSATLNLTFTPSSVGAASGTVKIISNDPDTLSIALSGTGTRAFLANAYSRGWNLMSIPFQPDTAAVTAVIGDDVGSYFIYAYASGGYFTPATISLGQAYWLGLEAAATIDAGGTPRVDTVSRAVAAGWNQVGVPYITSYRKGNISYKRGAATVSADSAVSLGWIQNMYYGYSPADSSYKVADTLKPWAGYWFAGLMDSVTMVFSHGSSFSKSGQPTLLPVPENDVNNWYVSINAAINANRDNLLVFGANSNANDGFDNRFDMAKPPLSPVNGAVETYFENSTWNSYISKFSSDIRKSFTAPQAGKSWSFKVRATSDGTLILSWPQILSQIPQPIRDNYSFILTGQGIATQLNMLTSLQHSFTAQAGRIYTFAINASVTGVESGSAMPIRFDISQNYPNPFNPTTMVSYTLPVAGQVSLKVYNILGNEVKTVFESYHAAGEYSTLISAEGMPSGVYFYKLALGSQVVTRKMVVMK